jgi:L-seryl-tRNA(Ser) seleniumtransferase
LLRVHPSNFRVIGFTERPSLLEFVTLGRSRNIPTFEDLGSGRLTEFQSVDIGEEPSAVDSIRAGVDVISFSGDKLLGGPQAGIIAGKSVYIDKIRRNPLFRALRVDKLTIAVLDYVLHAYVRGEVDAIPTWRMLRTPESAGAAAKPIALKSIVGGGSAPEVYLPSWGVTLEFSGLTASDIESRLRQSQLDAEVEILLNIVRAIQNDG